MVAVYDELLAGTGAGPRRRLGPMTATARRPFAIVLIALAVAAFAAQQLSLSALRRQPRYDEVSYSRGRARLSTGRGRGRRDPLPHRRPVPRGQPVPAYLLVLQAFAHDAPGFYADAKLLRSESRFS